MDAKTDPPSKIWYVAHMFLWVITGLASYMVWKEKNPEAARRTWGKGYWDSWRIASRGFTTCVESKLTVPAIPASPKADSSFGHVPGCRHVLDVDDRFGMGHGFGIHACHVSVVARR